MNVYDAIKTRRAVREFSSQPIPRDQIELIVNAGRLSGSAKNRQPWTFLVVTDRLALEKLSDCGPWCKHVAGAAFAVVLIVDDLHDPPTLTTPFDLGRASQNMMLAAWEIGVGSVMGTIYDPAIARTVLAIPADKAVPWLISFGFPAAGSDPRERPARKSGRRSLSDVIAWEHWQD